MTRRTSLFAIVLGSWLLAACVPVARPDGGTGLLPVGAIAPNVVGTARDGARMSLVGARGHAAVVYFYPQDATPGCTREACAFRDAFAKFAARRVTIFGVSQDSAEEHQKFRAEHDLPFPLVADEDGSIALAYGVGSTLGMTARVTFLVDANGRIARVWPDVDPAVHADEVLAAVGSAPR